MFAASTQDGSAVDMSRPRTIKLTSDQARMRRYFLWLWLRENGLPDPVTGRRVNCTSEFIAELFGTTRQMVRHGIVRASAIRDEINADRLDAEVPF